MRRGGQACLSLGLSRRCLRRCLRWAIHSVTVHPHPGVGSMRWCRQTFIRLSVVHPHRWRGDKWPLYRPSRRMLHSSSGSPPRRCGDNDKCAGVLPGSLGSPPRSRVGIWRMLPERPRVPVHPHACGWGRWRPAVTLIASRAHRTHVSNSTVHPHARGWGRRRSAL